MIHVVFNLVDDEICHIKIKHQARLGLTVAFTSYGEPTDDLQEELPQGGIDKGFAVVQPLPQWYRRSESCVLKSVCSGLVLVADNGIDLMQKQCAGILAQCCESLRGEAFPLMLR